MVQTQFVKMLTKESDRTVLKKKDRYTYCTGIKKQGDSNISPRTECRITGPL